MMHIAFTIDNRFVRPCAVTMVSVLRNNVPYEIVFHVIGLNLHQEDVAFFSACVRLLWCESVLFMKWRKKR